MARPKNEQLQKHTMNFRAGDMEALQHIFPNYAPAVVVRQLISRFIDRANAAAADKIPQEDIGLNIDP